MYVCNLPLSRQDVCSLGSQSLCIAGRGRYKCFCLLSGLWMVTQKDRKSTLRGPDNHCPKGESWKSLSAWKVVTTSTTCIAFYFPARRSIKHILLLQHEGGDSQQQPQRMSNAIQSALQYILGISPSSDVCSPSMVQNQNHTLNSRGAELLGSAASILLISNIRGKKCDWYCRKKSGNQKKPSLSEGEKKELSNVTFVRKGFMTIDNLLPNSLLLSFTQILAVHVRPQADGSEPCQGEITAFQ